MKILPLFLLTFFAIGCASDKKYEDKEIQMQEEQEELNRTGHSDDIGPGFDHGTTSSPHVAD